MEKKKRKLILEDGSIYTGYGFGADKETVCEIVFNTSVVGYQEIVSDPSYTDQAIVMSYPLIGNYGITDEDYESDILSPAALVVRDYTDTPSNFRYTMTLSELLYEGEIPGIYGIDTRKLVRSIRDLGSRRCIITDEDISVSEGIERIHDAPVVCDAVSRVSSKKKWYSRTSNPAFRVAVIDCGIKKNIIRKLNEHRCNVIVMPYDTAASDILSLAPDGVFVSNGPGDPTDVKTVIQTLKDLIGHVPIFGICLGHQLLSIAYGASTYKLKFGHRGGNHPVKNLITGHIEITSQNHSFAVSRESVKGTDIEISHINLLDDTVEGMVCDKDKVCSVQYHPESAPGPEDSEYFFDKFIEYMS